MKSPAEIKKGLESSIAELLWSINEGYPDEMIDSMENAHARMTDALAYIQQLEAKLDEAASIVDEFVLGAAKKNAAYIGQRIDALLYDKKGEKDTEEESDG